jgi:hypothetical protein
VNGSLQANGNVKLDWSSIGGTRYRIQYANGGLSGAFVDLIRSLDLEMDSAPYGTNSTQTFIDDFSQIGSPPTNVRCYRVKLAP